ncbi:malto-oligosyltrehalose synthase [Tsukamurella strandjordii]|uniref:malto-oligosyltrehalose synthase n=1 Tax=Tsukamurella TaxID=2060 RepID=UPI001C7D7C52|nr:malto-oligosyltrehalose synthase [Tsukamurella sp. TY48]GIZ98962.1 putative maltooligosyl trehalose synthase [Tsukamurella sp. TY48]
MRAPTGLGPAGRPVGATYRLQLGPGFTFADAAARVPYLADLGVTHLYLSPVLEAVAGSTHGYDVTDPTRVRAELGGRAGLDALADTAHRAGLGLVIDIVPNHVGVGRPEQNPWWWDVLRYGPQSRFADVFDIDWSADNGAGGRLALPVLARDDEAPAVTVDRTGPHPVLRYHDRIFPVGPDPGGSGAEIAAAQHYRLIPWNHATRTYRRFLAIDELAALRVEDHEVFAATHREIGSWFADGIADGVRVDHPDGLTDPAGYLRRLRALTGPDAWIVIEKVLPPGQSLDRALPVAGTTGYEALRELAHALVDPAGEGPLSRLHERHTGNDGAARTDSPEHRAIRADLAAHEFRPDVERLARTVRRETGATLPRHALDEAVLAVLNDSPADDAAIRTVRRAASLGGETAAGLTRLADALTAKAVEDTLYYRAARLIALQEVGGAPWEFGPDDPHPALAHRAAHWPAAMTTLSTHDTKRGEDVRARIGVLSQCPALWADRLERWSAMVPVPPEPALGLLLWQTLFGVWPADGAVTGSLRSRLHGYTEKAMREARSGTSWTAPDEAFESAAHTFLEAVLDGPVAAELTGLVHEIGRHGRADALAQKAIQLLGPGVPDVYQGTERWDDSLVDPDNRRPVDWEALRTGEHQKQHLVRTALRLRRERPRSFVGGSYAPLRGTGPGADHLLGFGRGPREGDLDVLVLASRRTLVLARSGGWRETRVALPPGRWTNRLTGAVHAGRMDLHVLDIEHPVALLVRD